jgi:DNA-binding NarL/FixJ family response regulator
VTGQTPISVVIADRRALILEGLAALVSNHEDFEVVGLASDPTQLIELVRQKHPAVVLMDVELANRMHADELALLRHSRLLLVSDSPLPCLLPEGTRGLLGWSASAATLYRALHSVAEGQTWEMPTRIGRRAKAQGLSPRELEIASLIAHGASNRDISQRLGITEQSVKNLISKILKKRGYSNRVQIAMEQWSEG